MDNPPGSGRTNAPGDSGLHLLSRARKKAPAAPEGSLVGDLIEGRSAEEVAARRGVPLAAVEGIRGFYDGLEQGPQVCEGAACHFAGGDTLALHLERGTGIVRVRCLGHCYAAPSFRSGDAVYARPRHMDVEGWVAQWGETGEPAQALSPVPRRALVDPPVLLRNLLSAGRDTPLEDYDLPDGAAILAAVEASGLRGRGGATFPTAAKWNVARQAPGAERYVVAHGDQGDPGSYADRLLLEEDPHAVLAGMLACARAIGARHGVVFIRTEYPRARRSVQAAIDQARAAGRLGGEFDVEVFVGSGVYVRGEETAMLNAIQGLRGEPRPRPPYPAESGLWGLPTVVQHVETLAMVPWIVRTGRGSGTKAVSLSGAVSRPGVVEVGLGTSLRRVLDEGGGGAADGRRWKMALVGGPLGHVVPERNFDVALSYETLPGLGHAAVVVLDDRTNARALAEHLFDFVRAESCGTCTPCRVGTSQLPYLETRPELERLLETLEIGSLCGFGQAVPRPIRDLIAHFGEELFA
jgi:NADH:ubiquinone oxidoreductase subunit F (NADH-binding)